MKLLKHLRSNEFAIIVAILSVLVQSFHSFTAFYNTSSLQNSWGVAQAVLFSLVIDLAILFYTVRGRRDIAIYAAVAMVVINCYYYYQHLGVTFEFIFGCFLSLIIPISVYFYSEEIKDDDTDAMLSSKDARIKGLESIITAGKDENKRFASQVDELRIELVEQKKAHEVRDHWTTKQTDRIKQLESDLNYVRKQMSNEEFVPDPIEVKTNDDNKTIDEPEIATKITRTGGAKL